MSLPAKLRMLPPWLSLSLIIGVVVGFSVAGLLVVRRFIPHHVMKYHSDVTGYIFTTLGLVCGVMLALVIYVVWVQYNNDRVNAGMEAEQTLNLMRGLRLHPNREQAAQVRKALVEYARAVHEKEYPAMRRMEYSGAADEAFGAVWVSLKLMDPRTRGETAVYSEIPGHMDQLARHRFERLMAAHEELPPVRRLSVILEGIVPPAFCRFFGSENLPAHIVMTAMPAFLPAVLIYMIIRLDRPYQSEDHVRPLRYETVLDRISTHER